MQSMSIVSVFILMLFLAVLTSACLGTTESQPSTTRTYPSTVMPENPEFGQSSVIVIPAQ